MRLTKIMVKASALLATALLASPIYAQTCAGDTDCAQGMICWSKTGKCAYRWELPCSADANCGAGFLCQPSTMTSCSGSAPSTPDPTKAVSLDAGVASPPACTSVISYPGTCQSKVTTCNTDADCPAPWICAPWAITISAPTRAPVDAGAVTSLPPDYAAGTTSKTCQAPDGYSQASGSDRSGTGGNAITLSTADAGVAKGTTPSATPTLTPTSSPTPPTNSDSAGSTGTKTTGATTGSSGCSIGLGALPNGTLVVLGLAAALGLLGRKRDEV